jgi:uroporphyrin-III C-methyltransferase
MPSKVIIAGAGPGDPELLTLKALKYLQQAEVVFTDRLVSEAILYQYVNPMAEIIFVGKEGGNDASFKQSDINRLLVTYALQDKRVVRLKGGDLAVFSNVLDELHALVSHGIDYELVPGITAASGASAYAGIPLTARGYARGLRVLTCYQKDVYPESYWQELAATEDTLVFYMSGNALTFLVQKMVDHHIHKDKEIAIIEQATTPAQRVRVFSVYDLNKAATPIELMPPTLVVIGKVVALQEYFQWLPQQETTRPYFKPQSPLLKTLS